MVRFCEVVAVCMFLSIRELEQEPVRFDLRLAPGAIELDSEFQQKTPLLAVGGVQFNDATEEISVQGRIQVGLQMDCNRCLESFQHDVDESFDLIYRPSPVELAGVEISIKASESDVGFYEGPGLELNDVLLEQVLLAVPMQRVCRADCQGICPACGQNRNEIACRCHEQVVDNRWAALRNL